MEEVAAMLTSSKDTWNTYVQMPSIQLLKCIVLHSLTPCACTYSVAYMCARPSCIWQHHGLCGQGWWGVLGEACRGERTLLLFSVFKLNNFCQVRTQSAPDSWSWVQQGGISSVKNQVCAIHVNFLELSIELPVWDRQWRNAQPHLMFQILAVPLRSWLGVFANLFHQGQCGSCAAFATVAVIETWWSNLLITYKYDHAV